MPGRQSHGRPITAGPEARKPRKSKAKARGNALDAYAIAERQTAARTKGTRTRDLDVEPDLKRRRHEAGDEEEGEEGVGQEGAQAKRQKRDQEGGDSDVEFHSDSEGNEWRVGVGEKDDDSEIDSDDAFGESDDERYGAMISQGNTSKKKAKGDDSVSEDDNDEYDDSLGEDAIDLAQALDDISEDEEESVGGSASNQDEESDGGSSGTDDTDDDDNDDDDEDEDDSAKLDALQELVLSLGDGSKNKDDDESLPKQKVKVDLQDLGLFGVKDPNIKKSLKLIKKEEKSSKPGSSKKLDAPLARRQQDKLLRIAASETANKTLDRWTETVKHNRRAEHLVFPLPESLQNAGLDNRELLPLSRKSTGTELEQAILSIMEESGLGPSSKPKQDEEPKDETLQRISRSELHEAWGERRRQRELQSREHARAKRIKKIKSKTYRRIHRKQERKEMEMAEMEDGDGHDRDSEEEREEQHRRRAMERMGSRLRESKWAKKAKNTGRAAWDVEFRAGINDMARRDEELRRRVEGREAGSGNDDDSEGSESGDDNDKERILSRLQKLNAADDEEPETALMKMPFMKRAELAQKKANDEAIAQIVRDLASDGEADDGQSEEDVQISRRSYGTANSKAASSAKATRASLKSLEGVDQSQAPAADAPSRLSHPDQPSVPGTGLWSIAEAEAPIPAPAAEKSAVWSTKTSKNRKSKRAAKDLELDVSTTTFAGSAQPSALLLAELDAPDHDDEDDDDNDDRRIIPNAAAFGGDDSIEADFVREKAQVAEDDDDRVIDNFLPGWGSWAGEGVSKRSVKADLRRMTVVKGVDKNDRKDARLARVIINEKRIKKNDKYLASQLPYEFESKDQYERSLRQPVGPEWSTKETFQSATKPRVIIKQGIIAPMSKPRM